MSVFFKTICAIQYQVSPSPIAFSAELCMTNAKPSAPLAGPPVWLAILKAKSMLIPSCSSRLILLRRNALPTWSVSAGVNWIYSCTSWLVVPQLRLCRLADFCNENAGFDMAGNVFGLASSDTRSWFTPGIFWSSLRDKRQSTEPVGHEATVYQ